MEWRTGLDRLKVRIILKSRYQISFLQDKLLPLKMCMQAIKMK